jgi:hypothetical protein
VNGYLAKLRDDAHMHLVTSTRAGRKMLKGQLEESLKKSALMEQSLADAREEQALLRKWIGGIEA